MLSFAEQIRKKEKNVLKYAKKPKNPDKNGRCTGNCGHHRPALFAGLFVVVVVVRLMLFVCMCVFLIYVSIIWIYAMSHACPSGWPFCREKT